MESLYDNGRKIIGLTPATKTASISFRHALSAEVARIFRETQTLSNTLKSSSGKIMPYGFAAFAWIRTIVSATSKNPDERAKERGYTLK